MFIAINLILNNVTTVTCDAATLIIDLKTENDREMEKKAPSHYSNATSNG